MAQLLTYGAYVPRWAQGREPGWPVLLAGGDGLGQVRCGEGFEHEPDGPVNELARALSASASSCFLITASEPGEQR